MAKHFTSKGKMAFLTATSVFPHAFLTRIYKVALLIVLFVNAGNVTAQLTGIKTIPGDYATIQAAVTDLNSQGVGAGGVTFNVAAGHTETLANKIIMTATGTVANPIIIQKNGVGANPEITSYVGTVSTPSVIADGFFVLAGSDYVTIDGIDLKESAANATTTEVMEFGYGLFKASDTDGCQNNVIKNCKITLNRIQNASWTAPGHNGSTGIAVLNGLYTATGVVTVTAASGSNSFNKLYGNTIENCNAGIVFVGYGDVSPFTLGDTNNDVGGTSVATGNTILNFGGGASTNPATGIFANNQWGSPGFNCSFNTINNNNGMGVNHATTLRGIFLNSSSTSASATCNSNHITVHGGATTSQVSFIENSFGSTPAGNTININNNVLTGDYLTATSGVFYGIYNTATPAILNIQNNTISNYTYSDIALTGSGANYMIYSNASNAGTTKNILNNTISNISRTGTTGGTTIGIYVSSGTGGMGVNIEGNTITNMSIDGTGTSSILYGIQTATGTIAVNGNEISNLQCLKTTGTGALYGIYNISSPTNENFNNNTVSGLIHSGTGTTYGIYAFTTTGTRTVSGNVVYNLATGGTTIAGINMNSSSPTVFNNKIYDIQSSSTGAPTVSGLLLSGTSTSGVAEIYNNLIGELHAPDANSGTTPTIRGINITGTSTTSNFNFSYNTVYISTASTGTNFSTAALYATGSTTATSGALTLKNNIFVNTSTANGTGLTTAYRRSSTSITNYTNDSNNNLFYAGTPSATNVIFDDGGTNTLQTLGDFKTFVAPREASSVTESPNFLSTVGANANFLHINPAVSTQIESGGIPVAGITTDFDGNTRDVTTPDIGADEFAGIPIDINPPNIVYTPLDNSCSTGARMLTATITDASGVPTAGIGLPVLYWSLNAPAGPFTAATATSLGSDQYEFTFGGSASLGDVVHYYIVAQDGNGTPNIGASPAAGAGGFTANPPAAATPPTTPSSYQVQAAFTGTYTVGAAGNFATLTAAVDAYNNTACMTGPVVFELIDASYLAETLPITINQNPNASATNTLTIRPASGNAATISGSSSSCIIRLNGADYVTIDGSNSGGTDRSLSLENTATTANSVVICVSSLGAGLGAINNTIKNTNIMAGEIGTTTSLHTFGIHVAGTTISNTATGADNDNLTIQNNAISKARYGIYARATSTNPNDTLQIIGNEIGSNDPAEYVTFEGIDLTYAESPVISQNRIFNLKQALSASNSGMNFGAGINNGQITRNEITGVYSESTGGYGAYGIYFSSTTSTSNNLIANNFISDLRTVNYSTGSSFNAFGIRLSGGTNTKVYYNSVNLFGDITIVSGSPTQPNSAALYISTTSVSNLEVKNNIFRNTQTFVSGTPKIYSVWAPSSFIFGAIDNNIYFGTNGTGGNPTVYHIGRVGTTDYTTLLNWQGYTGQDNASIFQDPVFLSDTDLHLNPAGTPAESGAMPLAAVTVDYDGNARNGTTPDIGADEGNFILLDQTGPAITYTDIPNSVCTNSVGLDAEVTDASGINTAGGTKPRIWYKKSTEMNVLPATNTAADDGWKYVEASNASTPFSFTLDYSLLTSAVVNGDVIEYFVVAQDLATTPNVGTNSATYTSPPATVALGAGAFPVSGVKSYTILAAPVTITSQASPGEICISGDVTLSLTGDPSTGAEYQWQSSPMGANTWSPIIGATTATYVVTGVSASTDYRCVISCGGTPITASPSAPVTVTVSNPMVLTTTPGSECGPGPVSVALGATASMGAVLNWYAAPTGGTSIGTGTTFNTPAISSTTSYYVAASDGGTIGSVGPLNTSIGTISSSNIAIGTQRMFFDVLADVTILTIDIFPTAAIGSNGSITIRNNAQAVLFDVPYTTTVTGGALQTVPMNVSLPVGTGYEIGQGLAIQLNRNTTGAVYPYTSAAINITGNTFDPVYYYFFYNWQWATGCESARVPVVATIETPVTWYQDNDNDGFGNAAVTLSDCNQPVGYVANNTDCNDMDANEFPGQTWYLDFDGDDYSDGTTLVQCQRPANYYTAAELTATSGDCNDNNSAVNPGATEICNGVDDDCDGNTDEGVTTTYYADADMDGYGDPNVTVEACSAPTGYVADNTDCNDGNGAVNPGATEICNGIDDDCDGSTDEGVTTTFYADTDMDGYGDPNATVEACTAPTGYVANNTDCNDANGAVNPGATEICNGIDDDCDGSTDEGVTTTFYADTDMDGYGDPNATVEACTAPSGYVADNTDCNDGNGAVNPGAMEVCNGIDDDCDGNTDEGVTTTFYADTDMDGYGDPNATVEACTAPSGYVADNTDCNDGNGAVNPGAMEVCNGIDDDCDGMVDESGALTTYYADNDMDTYGDPNNSVMACSPPAGYVADNTDCNDANGAVNPGATEICNGIDDDCDGNTDEGVTTTFYADTDLDTYGDPNASVQACTAPMGFVANNLDCDDTDGAVNPGATEVCNGIDDDCDGDTDEGVTTTFYADTDLDGYGDPNATVEACTPPMGYVANNTDCNDTNGAVNPGATEICNGIDDDCDGNTDEGVLNTYYVDNDMDGYGDNNITAEACSAPSGYVSDNTDCNDQNGAVNPGATEICNGIDDDCDGNTDEGVLNTYYADSDMDTYGNPNVTTEACTAPSGYVADNTDCNDTNGSINPGAAEICNGLDDDCSGSAEAVTNTWTGNGNGMFWNDPANWSDGMVPLECQNVVILAGADVTVPAGFEGKGLSLDVAVGAVLTLDLTALLSIMP